MRLQNTIEKQKETKKLLEENLKVSRATLKVVEKTKKYIFWSQVVGWLKLIMIIAPIILALLYLPSLFERWREQIQGILRPITNVGSLEQFQGAKELIDQFEDIKQ